MIPLLRRWRRARLAREPFPSAWRAILRQRFRYYGLLTSTEQRRLQRMIHLFLAEKRFEGCAGLEITDEIRVTIAAQACLLLLNRDDDLYPGLQSILVYPNSYVAPGQFVDEVGVVHEGEEHRAGEAWSRGSVVLAWDEVRRDAADFRDGYNVTLHEFAHQLDQQDGSFDGAPRLAHTAHYRSWARTLMKEYRALQRAAERGEATVIDQYGATDPAEFFAVVTEAFFTEPKALRTQHPALYRELRRFYRQDPAERLERRVKR
ncbi:MAG TPA: M90 family metallopeptidase [Chthoniobacterales bacterium]|nr:M90 family metallopeptidase [Chthoniobacterales bacterium]